MKIRKINPEDRNKVYGLFRKGFPGNTLELNILQKIHRNERELHEWACIHTNKNIAYIAFSNAYKGNEVCGLHLMHFLVKPDFQGRGIGTELLSFALRQKEIQASSLYVLGDSHFYEKFGFELCSCPGSNHSRKGKHFLSIRNTQDEHFIVGYEPEYKMG